MKSLLFLLSATILVFITASAPVYAISWIVEPLIKIYPQIRGNLFFHLFIQFFDPWLSFFNIFARLLFFTKEDIALFRIAFDRAVYRVASRISLFWRVFAKVYYVLYVFLD
jgi:hypothetical protein